MKPSRKYTNVKDIRFVFNVMEFGSTCDALSLFSLAYSLSANIYTRKGRKNLHRFIEMKLELYNKKSLFHRREDVIKYQLKC